MHACGNNKRRLNEENNRDAGRRFFAHMLHWPKPLPHKKKAQMEEDRKKIVLATARNDSFKQSRAWLPQGFTKKLENGLQKSFTKVQNICQADVVGVDGLSRVDECVERTTTTGKKGQYLHHEMLCARILGLRVATPQFFQQTLAQRKKAKNSIKLKPAVKTSGPKALICTSQFKDQYPDTFAVLRYASRIGGSKWRLIEPEEEAKWKKTHGIHTLNQTADVHRLAKSCPCTVDLNRSGNGRFVKQSTAKV